MQTKLVLEVSDFSMKVAKLLRCTSSGTMEQFSAKVGRDIMNIYELKYYVTSLGGCAK